MKLSSKSFWLFLLLGTTLACFSFPNSSPRSISLTSTTATPTITQTHPATQTSIVTFTPTPYYPGLIVFPRIKIEYYDIEGSTREELLTEIKKKGPIAGLDHEHSIAAVEYDILYTWPGRGMAGCDVTKGEIWYSIKVYAPRWSPPSGTPAELIEAWIFFMDQVKSHEEDHIELVREYFQDMMQDIASAQSCSEAWDIANNYEQDLYRAQLKYDREAVSSIFPEH